MKWVGARASDAAPDILSRVTSRHLSSLAMTHGAADPGCDPLLRSSINTAISQVLSAQLVSE